MSNGNDAERETRELYRQLIEAWDKRNARAYALLFTTDANLVGFDGSQVEGQGKIGAHVSEIFSHHQTASYVTIVREVRRVTDDVMLLRASVGMISPGKDDINPEVNAVQVMVAVRQGSEWRISLFQNTPAALHGRPEEVEKLSAELRAAKRAFARTDW